MQTVQIVLAEGLYQQARKEGLFEPNEIQSMFRERLRKRARARIAAYRSDLPADDLTPEQEEEIAEVIREVRAERRAAREKGTGSAGAGLTVDVSGFIHNSVIVDMVTFDGVEEIAKAKDQSTGAVASAMLRRALDIVALAQ